MAKETAPAFQMYVKEWRSSRAVMRMTFAQRGMYLEMLLEQWENHSLPDDPRAVAELIGGTDDEWIAAWPVLRRKFCDRRELDRASGEPAVYPADYPADTWDASRRIVNVKLEQVRKERKSFVRAARAGGLSRAKSAKRGKDGTYLPADNPAAHPADAPAVIQATSSTASASASASPTAGVRARPQGIFAGALPAHHRRHTACSPNQCWCIDEAVHGRLVTALAPKHGGDREKAAAQLLAWYPTVWSALPTDTVIADDFKFWRGKASEAFSQPAGPPAVGGRVVAGVEATRKLLEEMNSWS